MMKVELNFLQKHPISSKSPANCPKLFFFLSKTILDPTGCPHNSENNRVQNAQIFEWSLVRVINGLRQETKRKEDKTYLQSAGWRTTVAWEEERWKERREETDWEEQQLMNTCRLISDFRKISHLILLDTLSVCLSDRLPLWVNFHESMNQS